MLCECDGNQCPEDATEGLLVWRMLGLKVEYAAFSARGSVGSKLLKVAIRRASARANDCNALYTPIVNVAYIGYVGVKDDRMIFDAACPPLLLQGSFSWLSTSDMPRDTRNSLETSSFTEDLSAPKDGPQLRQLRP
jgi:hypothetical protein